MYSWTFSAWRDAMQSSNGMKVPLRKRTSGLVTSKRQVFPVLGGGELLTCQDSVTHTDEYFHRRANNCFKECQTTRPLGNSPQTTRPRSLNN